MKIHLKRKLWRGAPRIGVVAVHLMLCACHGWAAQTDILNSPPFIAGVVKPNILFLMDDSDSMKRDFLPDYSIYWTPKESAGSSYPTPTDRAFWPPADPAKPPQFRYGHFSRQCNHLAYNPDVVYSPPLDDAGKSLGNASLADFDNPKYKPFYIAYQSPGINPPMSFSFDASDNVIQTASDLKSFYSECIAILNETTDVRAKVFKQVFVTSLDSQWTRQNFQNWLKYYGDRRSVMKTGVKQAFARVGGGYRVGFSVTSYEKADDNTAKNSWKFLNVKDFDAAQKQSFFTAVNKSDGYFDTPLRGTLSKAGQYFANKAIGQTEDPMQQSCQRNISILATDGGWTKAGESSSSKFGPFGVASARGGGAALMQQDSGSSVGRPFRDSGADQVVSLADVAYYYYNTDLRDGSLGNCSGAKNAKGEFPDVCKNDVKGVPGTVYESNGDMALSQHMTTYTLGLGLSGRIPYDADYRTAKETGAFHEIINGGRDWTKLDDFPISKNDFMPRSHTDDLWHAAVNGHGQYFSAADPLSVMQGLSTALSTVKATAGAASAAATTSNQPVNGDNDVFVSSFVSQKWIGDVQSFTIELETGKIDTDTLNWSARRVLDDLPDVSKRRIFYRKPGSPEPREFTAGNLSSDGLSKHFTGFCSDKKGVDGSLAPAQCMSLTPAQQDSANSAEQMVSFLRGTRGQSFYRKRESRLGDVVNAGLLYVGKPNFPYKDSTYLEFKSKARPAVVLAGANDGMLHAFSQKDGTERWAYVPTPVMKNMYKLADTSYPDNHVYFVDGTPQIGDVKGVDGWHTIVVGGLNAGGKGYYALDVTDTENPKVLWEFSHPELGLSFGNPIITKRTNGQWVVVFASGYNNGTSADPDEPSGDGNGRLFVLDALTGRFAVDPIPTLVAGAAVGKSSDPSGLAKINIWVDDDKDNTMLRAYGGDLLGNLWRFDIDGKVQPYQQALRLAQLRDSLGKAQPVTTKPALAQIKANGVPYAMVYVGTGRYLGMSDLQGVPQVQSLYAIKDPLTNSSHDNLRGPDMVEHKMNVGSNSRTFVSGGDVDLSSRIGWRLDLPGAGERVDVNPAIALDSLYVAGNIPEDYTCKAGGTSFVYKFNLKSGSGMARYQGDVLVQGLSLVQITTGAKKGSISTIARRSDATNDNFDDEFDGPPRRLKRSAWRALAH